MRRGLFITFEGTEASGKSTQIKILSERLKKLNFTTRLLREPGGTPIGEEVRQTLKHSSANHAMTPEAELLMMNASRAQLVREIIRPSLCAGEIILCDRFYDSTIVYQGYGRGLDQAFIRTLLEFAVGETRPDLTLFLRVPLDVSEARRSSRDDQSFQRDRFEEQNRDFFRRVEEGYTALSLDEADRIRSLDATKSIAEVSEDVWKWVEPFLDERDAEGERTYKSIGEWNEKKLGDGS